MRLRNIPGAEEKISSSGFVVQDPALFRGNWKAGCFGNDAPLALEIGCGKGAFLMEKAALEPDRNFLGIEKMSSVLLRAVEKRELAPELANLFFMRCDAESLPEIFAPGEVDAIYLNFSDPWPKDRHKKRRLTSREFLARYENVMSGNAVLEFKTDNADLFAFSVAELREKQWEILALTEDLHRSPLNEGNVMTEYEKRFSLLGNRICKLAAKPPAKKQREIC